MRTAGWVSMLYAPPRRNTFQEPVVVSTEGSNLEVHIWVARQAFKHCGKLTLVADDVGKFVFGDPSTLPRRVVGAQGAENVVFLGFVEHCDDAFTGVTFPIPRKGLPLFAGTAVGGCGCPMDSPADRPSSCHRRSHFQANTRDDSKGWTISSVIMRSIPWNHLTWRIAG